MFFPGDSLELLFYGNESQRLHTPRVLRLGQPLRQKVDDLVFRRHVIHPDLLIPQGVPDEVPVCLVLLCSTGFSTSLNELRLSQRTTKSAKSSKPNSRT